MIVDRMGTHTIIKWRRVRGISIIDDPIEGGVIKEGRTVDPQIAIKIYKRSESGSGHPNICSTAAKSRQTRGPRGVYQPNAEGPVE